MKELLFGNSFTVSFLGILIWSIAIIVNWKHYIPFSLWKAFLYSEDVPDPMMRLADGMAVEQRRQWQGTEKQSARR